MSEEDFFFCPLECGARIKSLIKHIQKCKNYNLLGIKYKLCEYNNTHIIRKELYETHLLICKSKKKFEEDENDSINDDDLNDKISDSSENEKKKEEKKEDISQTKNISEKKNENEEINLNKKKRRYRHEKALFKDENEIDQECLDFFNKVYI